VAAVAVVAAACGDDDEPAAEPGEPTGEVRFLTAENFWADWTPYQSTALSQRRLERHVYDYLVDFPTGDLTSDPEPQLATDWRQIDDTTWEFDLRDDVTFHDGQSFTAEDVKASVELASGFSAESAYALSWVPAEVEVVDPQIARITTEKPFASLLVELWWTPIVSAETLAGDPDELAGAPNGTGPFRLVDDQTTIKTMEANPDYWGDPPAIETLIWEFVQDPQTRLNALLSGEADVIDRVPPQQLETLEGEEGIELIQSTAIESVNLWVRPGRLPLWEENEHYRKAFAWSIDRQALVDNLVLGESWLADSFLPPGASFYSPQEPTYGFDPEQARAELEAGGITDGGPEFELWVAEGFLPRAREVVEAIADSMRQVGLKPKIVTSDVDGMIDDIFSDGGTGAVYHLSWASDGDAHSHAQVYGSDFVWNYGVPRIDELIQAGITTLDPEERARTYEELQSFMWDLVPHIPLYNSDFTIAHRAELQGLVVQPNVLRTDFHGAQLAS
jgi:peptide/nickel transport system substrate-binding protein